MKAHLINTHLLVPRSRSSAKVKVKYQGHVSQKMGVSGAFVFYKHILFCWEFIVTVTIELPPNDFFNSTKGQVQDKSKVKALADDKINVIEKLKFVLGRVKKHGGKRRKCWWPAFSPSPTMFSKGFLHRVIRSHDSVVELTLLLYNKILAFSNSKHKQTTCWMWQKRLILSLEGWKILE